MKQETRPNLQYSLPRQNEIYASLQPALPGLGKEGLIEGNQKTSIFKMFFYKTLDV